jgi:hypothetical protein
VIFKGAYLLPRLIELSQLNKGIRHVFEVMLAGPGLQGIVVADGLDVVREDVVG